MTTRSTILRIWLALCVLAIMGTACAALGTKPTVTIMSPPSGSQFHEGEDVAIQSTSNDDGGVTRVELVVDGNLVRADASPTAKGQSSFTLIQTWKATQGTHTILVRAYNAAGNASDPAGVNVTVLQGIATGPISTPTIVPLPGLTPGLPSPLTPTVGAAPPAATCSDNAAFVTDVSIPDGTVLAAGQTFNKTWRLSNNGTCTWGAGYQFVFTTGEAMGTTTAVVVPPTAPGASTDISVAMTAPTPPGQHTGRWQMRNAAGVLFGQSPSVKITVPGGAPPAATGCTGIPNIASFTASPASITTGGSTNLTWGAVVNADSAEIDQGIGGVETPGSRAVNPASTTTYTLTARCGANTKTATVTVTVNPPAAASCSGMPNIASFTASPATVAPGGSSLLSWGAVTNAESVEIDQGIGGVASPGTRSVTVPSTRTYTMTARCGANTKTATATVTALAVSASSPSTEQKSAQSTIAANSTGSTNIACPSGTLVTGGGYASSASLDVYNSTKDGNGWRVYAKNNSASGALLNAYAICMSNAGSGAATQEFGTQVSVSAGGTNNATMACPSGVVTGGGFALNTGEEVYTQFKSGNGWQVYAYNSAASSLLLNVYAVCLTGTSATTTQSPAVQVSVANGNVGSATSTCASGILTGGGFASNSGLATKVYTHFKTSGQGWQAYMNNTSGSSQLLNAYAICASF